jgi:hypothetical protein
MSKDNFIIFMLAVTFVTSCFLVFLAYLNITMSMEALAKSNEVVINNYQVKEEHIKPSKSSKSGLLSIPGVVESGLDREIEAQINVYGSKVTYKGTDRSLWFMLDYLRNERLVNVSI